MTRKKTAPAKTGIEERADLFIRGWNGQTWIDINGVELPKRIDDARAEALRRSSRGDYSQRRMIDPVASRLKSAHDEPRRAQSLMMNRRIEIDGHPVTIQTQETKNSFRTEITPDAQLNDENTNQLYQRATAWSRQLRSETGANSSIRCFRDGSSIVVEDTAGTITQPDVQQLTEYLQSPQTSAAGAMTG